jgi:transposase
MNRTQALQEKPLDTDQWQKLYYRYQQQYIRKRLDAIKLLKQGNSRFQVCQEVGCSYDTLTSWIDKYSSEGLKGLLRVITHHKPGRLNREQQQQIKAMVLEQRPTDYGIDRQMWTGAILSEVIAQRWQVRLKDSRIYELLAELGLSYQRAHRDYANANRQAQQQWVETVKKNFSTSQPRRR